MEKYCQGGEAEHDKMDVNMFNSISKQPWWMGLVHIYISKGIYIYMGKTTC